MEDETINEDALDRALAALPQEMAPARDLWPGIEAQIAPAQESPWKNYAMAASVCLALIVGSLLWFGPGGTAVDPGADIQVVRTDPVIAEPPAELPAVLSRPRMQFVSYPGDEYLATRDVQMAELNKRVAALEPEQKIIVEAGLATIQRALEDIDGALADDPDNALLKELMLSTYQRELETIMTMNRLAGSTRTDL